MWIGTFTWNSHTPAHILPLSVGSEQVRNSYFSFFDVCSMPKVPAATKSCKPVQIPLHHLSNRPSTYWHIWTGTAALLLAEECCNQFIEESHAYLRGKGSGGRGVGKGEQWDMWSWKGMSGGGEDGRPVISDGMYPLILLLLLSH